jgi:hypothetical protein
MEDRRKEDRRKLYGKPFLALLIGALPEDRRKRERRRHDALCTPTAEEVGGVRGGNVSESNRPAALRRPHQF